MLATLQYVLNSFFGQEETYFFDFKRFQRVEIKGVKGLKRDKIPQLRQVRSNRLQPGLYKGLKLHLEESKRCQT